MTKYAIASGVVSSLLGLGANAADLEISAAAAVHECGHLDSIGNLVGAVKPFAKGAIRVAHISTDEPVSAPEHLLIFVYEEPMSRRCYAISSNSDGFGFGSVDFAKMRASYNPRTGLLLSVPVGKYDPETGNTRPYGRVKIRAKQMGESSSVVIER